MEGALLFADQHLVESVDWRQISRIDVDGRGGDDIIQNATDITSNLRGGAGNDSIFGGQKTDFLYGGAGADRFLGIGSYGGSSGDYRFVDGDRPEDSAPEDALIVFANGNGNWNNNEIRSVDAALAVLVARTNSTTLLEVSHSFTPDAISAFPITTFVRQGNNGIISADNDSRGTINIYDGTFTRDRNDDDVIDAADVRTVVLHELGHNWDTENPNWQSFRNLSGWVQNPDAETKAWLTQGTFNGVANEEGWWRFNNDSACFVQEYGMFTPMEDWSTTWELYFRNPGSVTTTDPSGNAVLTQKLQAVDAFFTRMMG